MTIESEIEQLLLTQPIDLQYLFLFSRRPGGFLQNKIRGRVWTKLLGINRYEIRDYREYINNELNFNQIDLDIERSLYNYKEITKWDDQYRRKVHTIQYNTIHS